MVLRTAILDGAARRTLHPEPYRTRSITTSGKMGVMPTNDDELYWTGARNSFQFEPEVAHSDLLQVAELAEHLGYKLLTRDVGYTLEDIKSRLREHGPSYFLRFMRLQEDISPKASQPTVSEFISKRLAQLSPTSELIITDPYLFTSAVKDDPTDYAKSVAALISPLLESGAKLVAIVDKHQIHAGVRDIVLEELATTHQELDVKVVKSTDFHDRFWISDRTRGVIMGSSLNKIGSKVFFIDALSTSDVAAVVEEVDSTLNRQG